MESLLFFLEPLFYITIFSFLAYYNGHSIIQQIKNKKPIFHFDNIVEQITITSVIGLCFIITIIYLLSIFNLFNKISISICLLSLPVTLLFFQSHKESFQNTLYSKQLPIGLLIPIIAVFIPQLIGLYLPESGADALSYHLPYAKEYAQHGGLTINPYLRYPVHAHNFNLLFSLGFLFQGEILARYFHTLATLLLMCGIYALCTRFYNQWTAFLATSFFILCPLIQQLMISAYIDIGLALFIFTSGYLLLIYINSTDKHKSLFFYFSAVVAGIAMGTKYLGIPYIAMFLFGVLLYTRQYRLILGYLCICLLFASPWYIRNWFIAGNPLHPFAQDFFGYWLWTTEDMKFQLYDIMQHHGVDRTVWNFLTFPYIFDHYNQYKQGSISNFVLYGFWFSCIGMFHKKTVSALSIFVIITCFMWFYSSQLARYLIPTIPVMCIVTAYYLVFIIKRLYRYLPIPKNLFKKTTLQKQKINLLLAIVFSINTVVYLKNKNDEKNFIQYDKNWYEQLATNPEYQFADHVNRNGALPTFKLGFPYINFYFNGEIKGDWYGIANMKTFSESVKSEQDIFKQMLAHNVHFLLIDNNHEVFKKVHTIIENGGNQNKQFTMIMKNSKGWLYQINTKQ